MLKEIGNKRVLIYGAGLAFEELEKKFQLTKLNVVGISDIKFAKSGEFKGLRSIPPNSINEYEFDIILMTLIYPDGAIKSLEKRKIIGENSDIKIVFKDIIPQDNNFLNYLEKINFEKYLKKLIRKLKNKKVVIYCAGPFFQTIQAYYDLDKLNIVAVSDQKFGPGTDDEKFLNYPICAPSEIEKFNPDTVLIATKYFMNVLEELEDDILENTKIKVKPIIKKPIFEILKDIWD